MKKIFAIALALVMVLSMASAFAYCLTDINWACATDVCNNGTGKIEIVPVVKTNDGCYSYEWSNSSCAGAVNSEKVYFAVKLTVDAYPNTDWWDEAEIKFETKGLNTTDADVYFPADGAIPASIIDAEEDDEVVYYLKAGAWTKAKDLADGLDNAHVWSARVTNAAKAKVCVTLESKNEFNGAVVNGYTVSYNPNAGTTASILAFENDEYKVKVYVDKDDEIVKFEVGNKAWSTNYAVKTLNADGTKFYVDATTELDWTCNEYGKFLKKVMDEFKLAFGTCITDKAIMANFGWDDEVESCFTWSANAQAIVDAECVVAIPKTGDASVLAWLF